MKEDKGRLLNTGICKLYQKKEKSRWEKGFAEVEMLWNTLWELWRGILLHNHIVKILFVYVYMVSYHGSFCAPLQLYWSSGMSRKKGGLGHRNFEGNRPNYFEGYRKQKSIMLSASAMSIIFKIYIFFMHVNFGFHLI